MGEMKEKIGRIHHPSVCAHDGHLFFIVVVSTLHFITFMSNFCKIVMFRM